MQGNGVDRNDLLKMLDLAGKEVVKVVYVEGRLVNFVVK